MYYRLDENMQPVQIHRPTDDDYKNKWKRWDKSASGKIVSTVFLVIDHNHSGGLPILFETMVFPDENNFSEIDGKRYHSYEEANSGHDEYLKQYV